MEIWFGARAEAVGVLGRVRAARQRRAFPLTGSKNNCWEA